MIRQLWSFDHYEDCDDFNYTIDELTCLKNFIGSPPPPYTTEDLRRNEEHKKVKDRRISYSDVGEEIYVTIQKHPNEELGLTILSGEAFHPKWPTILDVKSNSPACKSIGPILIGDQIKELCGIATETLTHSQVLALFAKATDEVYMKLRRGVEPCERSFKWYKHPFSTVARSYDRISIESEKCDQKYDCEMSDEDNQTVPMFTSFKVIDDSHDNKKPWFSKPVFIRSLSASAVSKRGFLTQTPRQRRRTVDETSRCGKYPHFGITISPSKKKLEKSIAAEIEKLSLRDGSISKYDSNSSLNSALSTSTMSSLSSVSTNNTRDERQQSPHPKWMDHSLVNTAALKQLPSKNTSEDILYDKSCNIQEAPKTPVTIIRNSFRRKKAKKSIGTEETDESRIITSHSTDNTLLLTVWIADRKRLGVKFSEANVSPYGDSNIHVQEIKKTGTGSKLFREDDELLEIDGISVNGLEIREVNRIIEKLEGNYVEFKIFRPNQRI